MERFIIYCTEEQTKKALELGAPIPNHKLENNYAEHLLKGWFYKDGKCYQKITAEQMLCWLEEQDSIRVIDIYSSYDKSNKWYYDLYDDKVQILRSYNKLNSRKEATLAAIDAALEYLENKKL